MKIRGLKTKYHRYIFEFPFDYAVVNSLKAIQATVGWQELSFYKSEDGEDIGWVFSTPTVYSQIKRVFNPRVANDVALAMEKYEQVVNFDVSTADLNENLLIKTLKPLYPFQKQAVDFVDKAGGKVLIADEMGLGKTCEAIGYAVYKEYARVLIICPASVKENWQREVEAFAGIYAGIIADKNPKGTWDIIGYSNLARYKPYLDKQEYDLIILDEAHYVKNRQAKRTKQAFKLLAKAKDVLFLSGTPVMNRPIEIYNILNFIKPIRFWDFAMKYCGAKKNNFGWDYNGASNLPELKQQLNFMIRRTKAEVLPQLPEKTIDILTADLSAEGWEEYNRIEDDFRQWLIDNDLNENAVYAEALTKALYLRQCTVRHKNIKSVVDNFLENGKKILIFTQFTATVAYLQNIYDKITVSLTGATPTDERQGIIDQFQNDSGVRIFAATLKTGGVGLTLTAADTVLFTDLDWTPANHLQAEDRAHRIGQKNNVNIHYLIVPGTIEEKMWKVLHRKKDIVKSIIEGQNTSMKSGVKEVLQQLIHKDTHTPLIPPLDPNFPSE